MLLDGCSHTLSISTERRQQVLHMVQHLQHKKKATVKELQKFAGHLNFINRVIVPGRAFTRQMYAKFSGIKNGATTLKPHHHVKLDKEFKMDCKIWEMFLQDITSITRLFIDISREITSDKLFFYSDTSAKEDFGYGAIFGNRWMFGKWQENFIRDCDPSIEFLELFAVCAAIFTWQE